MCGVAGFLSLNRAAAVADMQATLRRMGEALRHRGPDDRGQWADPATGIGLAHQRLSILDLSPQGRQPMSSACGRYVVSFNGEIYNHLDLRQSLGSGDPLPGPWRGTSDTEVMLAAISRWGLRKALDRLVGMFALALWDRQQRRLHLIRDRLGEKPLYYGWCGADLVFGSELKAMRAYPAWDGQVDRAALTQYLRYGQVPAPWSIYAGVYKVPAASIITVQADAIASLDRRRPLPSECFWSPEIGDRSADAGRFGGSAGDAVDRLNELLGEAIRLQMVADVPVGAFLSGGVDSSTVVALMQSMSSRPVRTFTIGFMERGYNEAQQARAVAQRLGTEHTELYVTAAEAREVIPKLPEIYDEPFADSSQVPTFLVSRLARSAVTVSLSGDGGDELFGGYPRYLLARRIWRWTHRLPASIKSAAAHVLAAPGATGASQVYGAMLRRLPRAVASKLPGAERLRRLGAALRSGSSASFYRNFVSHTSDPGRFVPGGREQFVDDAHAPFAAEEPMHHWMRLDLLGYLPNDILVKVDRAAMANSLETRIPLLDHRVVEFALQLPLELKVRGESTKWLLRQLLYRYLPRQLVERPKMGFGVPIGDWLRGPLRDWAGDLLDEGELKRDGFLDVGQVRRIWREHTTGQQDWQYCLWDLLIFQAWLRQTRVPH